LTTANGNIFRQAKQLLRSKSIFDMTEEEVTTVGAAMIPLDLLPQFNDKTTDEGLEKLSKMFDGDKHSYQKTRRQK